MDLLNKFQKHIATKQFFREEDRLLLAVSGGMDSICLCELMLSCGYKFSVAHVNYHLRGEDSDADEKFVRQWAARNQLNLHVHAVDTKKYAEERKAGLQEAARDLRYAWFEDLAFKHGYNKILTAHHADDNLETLLHNFFRGTGLNGLTGIKEKRGLFVRPLLFAGKEEIRTYVKNENISYREDSSNATTKYTRNFLRHEIMPLLKKHYPSVENNMLGNIERFRSVSTEVDRFVQKHFNKLEVIDGEVKKYSALALLKSAFSEQVLLYLLDQAGGSASQLPELKKILVADSGKYFITHSHRILKDRRWIVVTPFTQNEEGPFVMEKETTKIVTNDGILNLKYVDHFSPDVKVNTEIINAEMLQYPLIFRRWRTGDYFYPLGMQHKKKLSRFFIDQKLSLAEKEKIWVLESAKRIVWVAGLRLDERFSVRKQGVKLIQLQWHSR